MTKKYLSLALLVFFLALSGQAYAQEDGEKATNRGALSSTNSAQKNGSELNIKVQRSNIKDLKNINKILQTALFMPYIIDDKVMGYSFERMKDDSPLKKLGLNQGDIITRVNGNELKTPEILFTALFQIDNISAISFDMIRDNNKKTLFVELQ